MNEYEKRRKNRAFESDFDSQNLLLTKIWDMNSEIHKNFADVKMLLEINPKKQTVKMKKGLLSIANDLREIANYLEEKTKIKDVEDYNE